MARRDRMIRASASLTGTQAPRVVAYAILPRTASMMQLVDASDEFEAASSGIGEAPMRQRGMGTNAAFRNDCRRVPLGAIFLAPGR
jgi:hypothetical protein